MALPQQEERELKTGRAGCLINTLLKDSVTVDSFFSGSVPSSDEELLQQERNGCKRKLLPFDDFSHGFETEITT